MVGIAPAGVEVGPGRVHGLELDSRSNGPGSRAVLHLQGCSLKCPGCFNPNTWGSEGGIEMTVPEALQEIGDRDLTISGGEPTEQLHFVLALVLLRRLLFPERTTIMYSGRSEEELNDLGYMDVLEASGLDGIVAGRYERDLPSSLPLRSSSNQKYLDLTGRVPEEALSCASVEVIIDEGGDSTLMGFPNKSLVRSIKRGA